MKERPAGSCCLSDHEHELEKLRSELRHSRRLVEAIRNARPRPIAGKRRGEPVTAPTGAVRLVTDSLALIDRLAPPSSHRGKLMRLGRLGFHRAASRRWRFFLDLIRFWRWLPAVRRGADSQPSAVDTGEQEHDAWDEQYSQWLASNPPNLPGLNDELIYLPTPPQFTVLIYAHGDRPQLGALGSLLGQAYSNWEAYIVGGCAPLPHNASFADPRVCVLSTTEGSEQWEMGHRVVEIAAGDWLLILDAHDQLKPDALAELVRFADTYPDADLIYTDEDRRTTEGVLVGPFFKPDWSPDLLLSCNYIGQPAFMRRAVVLAAGGLVPSNHPADNYDLILRVSERARSIGHIARPLLSRPFAANRRPRYRQAPSPGACEAVRRALQRRQLSAGISVSEDTGHVRVRYDLKGDPSVAIIIPTRDRVDLLRPCIDSLRALTTYSNYRIVVVDNASTEPETQAYLEAADVDVISYPHEFNFSAMMNLAAAQSDEDYLVFLNNDTEVLTPDWLEELLSHGQRHEVGIVGPRLIYPDGRPQHEGIAVGVGSDRAAALLWRRYYDLGTVTANQSAVSGACMLVRRSLFRDLGGFDEEFKITFNEVDFALRLWRAGYSVVYTPHATLTHIGNATRDPHVPAAEHERFRRRWCAYGEISDRFFNPNFNFPLPVRIGARPLSGPYRCTAVNNFAPGERDPPRSVPVANGRGPTRLGVNVSGRFNSEKGVGEASRAATRALTAAAIATVLNNVIDDRSANVDDRYRRFATHNPHPFNLFCFNGIETSNLRAFFPPGYFAGRYNIGYWVWELTVLPRTWVEASSLYDEVWVPSTFAAQCTRGLTVPVRVVPLALAPADGASLPPPPGIDLPAGRFIFTFIFDYDSTDGRKNPAAVIEAFKLAFPVPGEPYLYLKCSRGTPKLLWQLNALVAGRPDISIDNRVLPRPSIDYLFRRIDAYVSLHRAEGFGLTIAEAMQAGVPVIATGYSGNMDFMSPDNSYPVGYTLQQLERSYGSYEAGNLWAEPDVEHAAELMRSVCRDRDVAVAKARKGQATVRELLSPEAVGATMRRRLTEVPTPIPPPAVVTVAVESPAS